MLALKQALCTEKQEKIDNIRLYYDNKSIYDALICTATAGHTDK